MNRQGQARSPHIRHPLLALPELCVLKIFSYLPLNDLTGIHHFCEEWSPLQEAACRGRTQLTLILGQQSPNEDDDQVKQDDNNGAMRNEIVYPLAIPYQNELIDEQTGKPLLPLIDFSGGLARLDLGRLSQITVTFLIEQFPAISELEVHQLDMLATTEFKQFHRLLVAWSPQLVTLKISSATINPKLISNNFLNLLTDINAMKWPVLKHISLPFSHSHKHLRHQYPVDLAIMTKVEHLELYVEQGKVTLVNALKEYEQDLDGLRSLAVDLGDLTKPKELWRFYFDLSEDILSKFTCFKGLPPLDSYQCSLFYSHFVGLTQVQVSIIDECSMSQIVECFAPLTALICLQIYAVDLKIRRDDFDVRPSASSQASQPKLPSVRILSLTIASPFHDTLRLFRIAETFPALQIFELINHRLDCHVCSFPFESTAHYDECFRLQLQSLLLCDRKTFRVAFTPVADYEDDHRAQWSLSQLETPINIYDFK